MRTCTVDRCERRHKARGLCHTHCEWQRRNPGSTPYMRDPIGRFMRFVEVQENGCWHWAGSISQEVGQGGRGYGRFKHQGKYVGAHRAALMLLTDREVAPELPIDHTCHNPKVCVPPCMHRRCVNPDHLEQVTTRENLMRSGAPTAVNAAKTECLRGHPFTAENTYTSSQGKRDCWICRRARWRKYRSLKKERQG